MRAFCLRHPSLCLVLPCLVLCVWQWPAAVFSHSPLPSLSPSPFFHPHPHLVPRSPTVQGSSSSSSSKIIDGSDNDDESHIDSAVGD